MPSLSSEGPLETPSTTRRLSTLSIALPSSILQNAQSPELRIQLAGQIARAAAIYKVDEIIIFDEPLPPPLTTRRKVTPLPDATSFFKQILEYLETPQYLRKHLFPVRNDLRLVGLLNPLALPSHVARETRSKYRDGVSVGRTNHARNHGQVATSRLIDVGMDRLVEIDALVPLGMRVTVDMTPSGPCYEAAGKYLFGNICDRHTPRVKDGLYWGYKVRTEKCLSDIFRNNVDEKTYDLTIGTSERGTNIYSRDVSFVLPVFERALVVFGGVHGLEQAVCEDEALHALGIRAGSKPHEEALQDETEKDKQVFDVGDLFDFYVNTCPQQGSRTIRSEEAIFISLAALSPFLIPRA